MCSRSLQLAEGREVAMKLTQPTPGARARSPESHTRAPSLAPQTRSVSPVRTSSSIARQAHDVLEHEAEAEGTLKGCVRVCRLRCRAAKLKIE